eukprot:scaffold1869_cov493-Prasinococcus_capsulatus_cf.AAC.11
MERCRGEIRGPTRRPLIPSAKIHTRGRVQGCYAAERSPLWRARSEHGSSWGGTPRGPSGAIGAECRHRRATNRDTLVRALVVRRLCFLRVPTDRTCTARIAQCNIQCHKLTSSAYIHTRPHAQGCCARPRDHALWRARSEHENAWGGTPRGPSGAIGAECTREPATNRGTLVRALV